MTNNNKNNKFGCYQTTYYMMIVTKMDQLMISAGTKLGDVGPRSIFHCLTRNRILRQNYTNPTHPSVSRKQKQTCHKHVNSLPAAASVRPGKWGLKLAFCAQDFGCLRVNSLVRCGPIPTGRLRWSCLSCSLLGRKRWGSFRLHSTVNG